MFEVYWQHRFDPTRYGCVLADTASEASAVAEHIGARGPYFTKIVEV